MPRISTGSAPATTSGSIPDDANRRSSRTGLFVAASLTVRRHSWSCRRRIVASTLCGVTFGSRSRAVPWDPRSISDPHRCRAFGSEGHPARRACEHRHRSHVPGWSRRRLLVASTLCRMTPRAPGGSHLSRDRGVHCDATISARASRKRAPCARPRSGHAGAQIHASR